MAEESNQAAVRAFISYSWSSPTHEAWVINLASRLVEDGIDVVLDKWDLKPGHDAYQFMESMVTDKSVGKVLMICDRVYSEKADRREGGVGAESQIISPEIYAKGSQDKFAAAITDEDDLGNAFIPAFYKGRIYFDFRSGDKFEEAYEQLLRWLVGRPQHIKPRLGRVPDLLLKDAPAVRGTLSQAKRAEEAIRQGSPAASALLREYGEILRGELSTLAPVPSDDEPFDDAVVSAVEAMRPYLKQWVDLVSVAIRFECTAVIWDRILDVQERLGTLMFRGPDISTWHRHQFDAFKIIAHDAFLSIIAIALEEHRFDLVETSIRRPYLLRESEGGSGRATSDFTVFRQYVESLEVRNRRLNLNRISLDADLLKAAFPEGSTPSFEAIMQADFFLYIRFHSQSDPSSNWYPYSLVYAGRRFAPFPIFARAESLTFFKKMAGALEVADLEEFKESLRAIIQSERSSRLFDYQGLPVSYLANVQHLGVLP